MKKILWWGLIALIISGLFVPFRQEHRMVIKAKYQNIYKTILTPDKWHEWQPDTRIVWQHNPDGIKSSRKGNAINIYLPAMHINTQINGFGFDVNKQSGSRQSGYSFTILPDTNTRYTDIELYTSGSLFHLLLGYAGMKSDALTDIYSLKSYMENERAYYGIHIQHTPVTDTIVLVAIKVVKSADKDRGIKELSAALRKIKQHARLIQIQPVIANINTDDKDSVRIMIGMPVNKKTGVQGGFKFMEMPRRGAKQLVVSYSGPYGGRSKVYEGLKRYLDDHMLTVPAMPYERFLNNHIPLADTERTNMQIIYPIQ